MSPSPLPPDVDRPFVCVAVAWQAHEAELRGFLRHRLAKHQVPLDDCVFERRAPWLLLHLKSLPAAKSRLLRARQRMRDRLITVCRVNFDPDDGRVCGHDGRIDSAAHLCP